MCCKSGDREVERDWGGEGNDGACRKGFPRLAPFPHLHLPSAVALD